MFRSILLLCLAATAYGAAVRSSTILPVVPFQSRIIGGDETTIEEFPYQVVLHAHFNGDNLLCGGSIIAKNVILTAAHCTYEKPESSFTIRAGTSYRISGGIKRKVAEKHEHENYRKIKHDYDYCILFLSNPLKFGSTINAIALPEQGQETKPKTLAVTTGWGRTAVDDDDSMVLRKIYLPIVRKKKCAELFDEVTITDRMICAGPINGGVGTCRGDSGGPLVVNDELIGVTSWGHNCDDTVSVFAKVSYVVDWINDIISSD